MTQSQYISAIDAIQMKSQNDTKYDIRVSVIIPAFNAARTIIRAIDSVRIQDYPSLEIIVIDDGSTDGTPAVVRSNIQAGEKIQVIEMVKNSGVSAARNAGIRIAKGKYLAFLDADDIWLPEKIKKQIAIMENDPEVTIVSCNSLLVTESGLELKIGHINRPPEEGFNAWKTLLTYNFMPTPTILTYRILVEGIGGFDESLLVAEDLDLWIKLATRGKVAVINEVLTHYYDSVGSLMKRHSYEASNILAPMLEKHIQSQQDRIKKFELRQIRGKQAFNIGCDLFFSGAHLPSIKAFLKAAFYGTKPIKSLSYIPRALFREYISSKIKNKTKPENTSNTTTKRVLMVAFHFPPQASSSGIQRTLSFAKHLGAHNWEPMVLSASTMAYEHKNASQLTSIPSNLIVRRTLSLDAKRHISIAGHYPEVLAVPDRWSSWWFTAVPIGLWMIHKYKPQVIWSTFPIATAHLIGLTLHRLTGLPWIADFRDPMIQSEFPETKLQRKTYQWIENLTVLNCQTAIFTTQSTMQSYKVRYPKHLHNKFIIIENGYDEDDFSDVKPAKPAQPAKSTKCITLLHSGLLYMPGRNPSALFDAISSLKALSRIDATLLSIVLRSTGDINFYTALAAQYKVEDIVKILPPIPYKDALSEMLTVDGLLIFQGEQFNSQIPAKIYEYFRAKKPIFSLLDAKGETASMLKTAGFLNMVSIESSEAIVPALENFILQIGSNTAHLASDDLIEKSSRENRANELAGVLDQTRQINLSY